MAQAPRAVQRNLRRSTALLSRLSTDSGDVRSISFLLVFEMRVPPLWSANRLWTKSRGVDPARNTNDLLSSGNPDVVGRSYLYIRHFRRYPDPLETRLFAWGGKEDQIVLAVENLLQSLQVGLKADRI